MFQGGKGSAMKSHRHFGFLILALQLVASFGQNSAKSFPINYLPYVGGDPSLEDVYNSMTPPMTMDQWHIHDPSRIVATDGVLMIAVTGKEQADGYK